MTNPETESLTVVETYGDELCVVRIRDEHSVTYEVRWWDFDIDADDVQASRTPSQYGPSGGRWQTSDEAYAYACGYAHGGAENR